MRKSIFLCVVAGLLLASCSSNNKPAESASAQPAVQPAEYETGRVAFQKMYLTAHSWATDAQPFRLQSQFSAGSPVNEGKAGIWRASFASPGRNMMKMFMWSGLTGPDAPERGITFSAEDSWSPANTSAKVFNLAFLKIDSDQAYEVAEKNGGSKLTKKNPQQPVFFMLDWDSNKNQLLWHVIYGESEDGASLRIAVNATSGAFERIEK